VREANEIARAVQPIDQPSEAKPLRKRRDHLRVKKVLVLAAGRRRYVIEALKRAMPSDCTLLASDRDSAMPGLSVPGVQGIVEPSDSGAFDRWLLSLCELEGLSAVLSLHDFQIIQVSRLKDQLATLGTRWIGPSYDVANVMLDKAALAEYLRGRAVGMDVPTFGSGEQLPDGGSWVIKDRQGSGSSGLVMGASRASAQAALESPEIIVQEQVLGDEWNIDFFFWGDGVVDGVSAKRKLRMRAGETDAAEVVLFSDLPFDIAPLVDAFRELDHLGNIDIDIFASAAGVKVVDVNPRFGGGYAFSERAGYLAAEAVWALASGQDVEPFPVEATKPFRGAKSIEVVEL
jgi:carbamoyl-phosphate synthase large subunit